MSIELRVPEVGESITEVEIGEWLKNEGDFVERDDEVVVIETDKATVEVPAPEAGTLTKILKRPGETASVHEVIAIIDADGGRQAKTSSAGVDGEPVSQAKQPSPKPSADVEDRRMNAPITSSDDDRKLSQPAPALDEHVSTEAVADQHPQGDGQSQFRPLSISDKPLRSEAAEVSGEPKQPRLASDTQRRTDATARQTPERPSSQTQDRQSRISAGAAEKTVPMSHLRRRIAERLVQAQHGAALLTTFNEIDMTTVIELRVKYRDSFTEQYQTKLGFMSFFVKAVVEALQLVPEVNAEIRGENIVYHNFFDIGVAVGGGKGLVVPVLRQAEQLSFGQIENAIADFAQRAEQDKLAPDELRGGTFTISNGGIYGSLLSTPIVNPPQSAILGLHAIQDRPVARQGAVVVRPMMYVALTYDHRIIDGREAVKFLKHIKTMIEEPVRMLLSV